MNVREFIKARRSVVDPPSVDKSFDDDLINMKRTFVPVITPNGVLVNVQKNIKAESLDIPFTTYSNDFMLKNGVKQLKDIPLSSFAVFDAIKDVVKPKTVN